MKMQWLIDLIAEKVIATIGIPPTFIDRGDPVFYDFVIQQLVADGAWHELDLSGIIPEGAQAVSLSLAFSATVTNRAVYFRKNGNANAFNSFIAQTIVALINHTAHGVVALSTDRKIDYRIHTDFNEVYITVAGWWL